MHELTRYILRQSLGTTLFVTAALSAAIWLTQSLRLVDLIVNRGLSAGMFFYLGLLILPRFVDIVLPIGIFISVLFTYNRLIAESEIVVMRAAGMSQFGLAKPAFILSGIGVVILFALSAYFLPTSNRAFKDLQFEIRNKLVSAVLQEGAFTTISDNLTVYVRGRDANDEMTGFLVQDERDPDKAVTIIAERGAFVETGAGSRVFLVNGNRQQLARATGKLSVLTFEKYTLDLTDARDVTAPRAREPQERYLGELLFPREDEISSIASEHGAREARTFRNSLRLEGHQRLIVPLTAIAFVIIPLVTLLCGEFNRRGQVRRILLAAALAMLFETLDLGLRNLAVHYSAGIALMYLNALLPAAIGCFFLLDRRRRSSAPRAALPLPAERGAA
jgi:lipopolysaccharide export system permease protein